jgi:hypothetical protein
MQKGANVKHLLVWSVAGWMLAGGAYAADNAVIEAVQMPAWIVHDGVRSPVSAGATVQGRDEIVTGDGARILLRMPEGSSVKLGADADFKVDALTSKPGNGGTVMSASLNVLKGAFRFTTALADKIRGSRDVNIHFLNVTAGIRGTDVWGKSTPDKQVVCLIEGKVEVSHKDDSPVLLADPLTFYVAQDEKPAPVAPVSLGQIATWALETDVAAGHGAQVKGGKWHVTALDTRDELAALDVYTNLRTQGYAAQFHPAGTSQQRHYEVALTGFETESDASAVAAEITSVSGTEPKIGH